jgi:hypothetical protein
MSELLKKYESIDESKLSEGAKKILNRVKTLTADFTTDDAKNNKIADDVLNEIMKKFPDSVKIVKRTPKAKTASKKTHKATHTKKSTQTTSSTAKSSNNIMSVAKEIQKAGESWKDAMERAKAVLKERKEGVVQQKRTELEKLYALVKTKKELQGFSKSDIERDAVRQAKPLGSRVVTKEGYTSNGYGTFPNKLGRKYWETRDRHADRLAPNYPKDMPLLASGGGVGSKKYKKGDKITTEFGTYYVDGIDQELQDYIDKHKSMGLDYVLAEKKVNIVYSKYFNEDNEVTATLRSWFDDKKQPTEKGVRSAMIWSYDSYMDYQIKAGGGSKSDSEFSSMMRIAIADANGNDKDVAILKKYSTDFKDVLITIKEIQALEEVLETKGAKDKKSKDKLFASIDFLYRADLIGSVNDINGKPVSKETLNKIFNNVVKEYSKNEINSAFERKINPIQMSLRDIYMGETEEQKEERLSKANLKLMILEHLRDRFNSGKYANGGVMSSMSQKELSDRFNVGDEVVAHNSYYERQVYSDRVPEYFRKTSERKGTIQTNKYTGEKYIYVDGKGVYHNEDYYPDWRNVESVIDYNERSKKGVAFNIYESPDYKYMQTQNYEDDYANGGGIDGGMNNLTMQNVSFAKGGSVDIVKGAIKVGVFSKEDLKTDVFEKALAKKSEETGLTNIDLKTINKGGKTLIELYLIPNKSDNDVKIKDWYLENYPTDDLGEELNDEVTFEDMWNEDYEKYNIYEVIGVGDSVIRERLFEHLAEIKGVSYDVVYRKLFSSDGFYAKGGGVFSSNDLWHKPSNSYLTIDNKSGVVKNVKEFNGNRKKEINIDGDVYRKNTTYGTYNSIKDNTVLTKQIVEKNFSFAEGGDIKKLESSLLNAEKKYRKAILSEQVGVISPEELKREKTKLEDIRAKVNEWYSTKPIGKKMADGGAVSDEKIWDLLHKEEKLNFITKYKPEIEKNLKLTRDIIFNSIKSDNWDSLNENIKNVFNKHIQNKKFYFENIGKKVTWEDYKGEKRKGEIDGIDFNGNYIIIEPDELYGGDTLSPDEVTIKDSSKKKYWLFSNGGAVSNDRMFNFLKDDLEKLEISVNNDDKEEVERFFSYWLSDSGHLKSIKTENNDRMFNFLKDDLAELEKAINNGDKEEVERFFSYWIGSSGHLKSLKMANGGSLPFMTDPNFGNFQNTGAFEDGGVTDREDFYSKNPRIPRRIEITKKQYLSNKSSIKNNKWNRNLVDPIGYEDENGVQWVEFDIEVDEKSSWDIYSWITKNIPSSEIKIFVQDKNFNKYELGGAFMMTDLAGHTGGSDGLGNPMPLSGVSGTHYTGLVGETGAMSSGELFEAGGAMMQNQQVINDASQSYVNYYLGEGASQGIYKDGGSIPNNYAGRTPEDVWNNWSSEQKIHFMQDHKYNIFGDRQISKEDREKFIITKFQDLSRDLRIIVEEHVQEGQYAKGGSLGKALYVEWSSWFISNKYDEEKIMSVLESIGAKKIHLENDRGWFNQPEVVVFYGDKNKAQDALNEAFDTDYIRVSEKDWRTKKMADGGSVGDDFEEVIDLGAEQYYTRPFGIVESESNGEIELVAVATIRDLENYMSEDELPEEGNFELNITLVPTEEFISEKILESANDEDSSSISDDSVVNVVNYAGGLNYSPQERVFFESHQDALDYLMSDELKEQINRDSYSSDYIMYKQYNRLGQTNSEYLDYLMGITDRFAKGGGVSGARFKFDIGDKVMIDDRGYVTAFTEFDLSKPAEIIDRSTTKMSGKTYYFYKVKMADGRVAFNRAEQSKLTLVEKGSFAKGGFVGTVEFNVGDTVWQKDEKRYATVMNNYGDPINGDYGDIRLDTTGNTSIYTFDPNRKSPATASNATGYNLIKVGEKGDTGKFTPKVLDEMKESANRLIDSRRQSKDKEGIAYYQEVYKRLLDGEFDSMTGAKSTASNKKGSRDYTYVPNKDVKELSVVVKGELKELMGSDILDGVYVKNSAKSASKVDANAVFAKILKDAKEAKSGKTKRFDASDLKKINVEMVKKLVDAGYTEQQIRNVIFGYAFDNEIVADNELEYDNGIFSYEESYVKEKIDDLVEAQKNKEFVAGIEYPDFDWQSIIKKYKITSKPKNIVIKRNFGSGSYNEYYYEVFVGENIALGHNIGYKDFDANGKLKGDYTEKGKKVTNPTKQNAWQKERGQKAGFNGGYWYIVSSKIETIDDVLKTLLSQKDGYCKELELYSDSFPKTLKENKIEFADGGLLSSRQIDKLDNGFTIPQLNDMLDEMFPDSFGFEVFKQEQSTIFRERLHYEYDNKVKDDKLELYFHHRNYGRDLNYEVHQGQENTYFKFQLVDEEVNTYIGTFGFKDEGDVDASYITKFISFLQDAFHYPLQVKHFVMANGGAMNSGGEINVKKRNFDVIIMPKELEIEVQITRADTVDHYGLNDAEVEWHQERWGYVIKADDNKKFNKALRVLGITQKFANGGFMNDVYADGGEVKDENGFNLYKKLDNTVEKDFYVWEYEKPSDVIQNNSDMETEEGYTEKRIVDYLIARMQRGYIYAFHIQGVKGDDFNFVSGTWQDAWDKYDNDDYKDIDDEEDDNVSSFGIPFEDDYAKGGMMAKGGKFKKYIDHADIKYVALMIKGSRTIVKGSDVLNGANLLEDGGDLSKIAFYVPKRDVISVTLNNGKTIKPVNGYWLKKGSEPMGKKNTNTPPKTGKVTSPNYPNVNFNHKVVIDGKTVNLALSKSYVTGVDGSKQYDFIDVDGNSLTGYGFSVKEALSHIEEYRNRKPEPKPTPAPAPVSSGSDLTKLKKGDRVLLKDGSSTREATVTEDGLDSQKRVRVRPNGFPFDISVTLEENNKTYVIKKLMSGGYFANGGGVSDYINNPEYKEMIDKMQKLTLDVKGRVVRAIGLDSAIEFYDADYPIRPYQLLEKAVRKGFITLDEINERVVDSAMETAQDSEDMEEVGSSDETYAMQEFLNEAGFKTVFVQGRLLREYADGGFMNDVYADGGEIRRFNRHEQMDAETREEVLDVVSEPNLSSVLTNYLYGLFDGYDYSQTERFKEEISKLKSKDSDLHDKVNAIYKKIDKYKFEKYDDYADGGFFGDNDGFMKADNNRNFRYPEKEVYVEIIDEPIDLISKFDESNNVDIKPLSDDIDLTDDKKIKAILTQQKRGNGEKFLAIAPNAFEFMGENIPMPSSNKHKND